MKKAMFFLAILLAAAPAGARTLWENVESGMTVQQVRALYPAGERVRHRADRTTIRRHSLIEQCRADVHILHPNGRVDQVVLRGEPAIMAECGTAIFEVLRQRLGPPLSEETGRPSILQRIRTTYVWNDNGIHLRYVRFSTEGWGGAGLGNASWEMTLSAAAGAPDA